MFSTRRLLWCTSTRLTLHSGTKATIRPWQARKEWFDFGPISWMIFARWFWLLKLRFGSNVFLLFFKSGLAYFYSFQITNCPLALYKLSPSSDLSSFYNSTPQPPSKPNFINSSIKYVAKTRYLITKQLLHTSTTPSSWLDVSCLLYLSHYRDVVVVVASPAVAHLQIWWWCFNALTRLIIDQ